jgi:hypothetical protein
MIQALPVSVGVTLIEGKAHLKDVLQKEADVVRGYLCVKILQLEIFDRLEDILAFLVILSDLQHDIIPQWDRVISLH